jgi:hypothetical protein
MILTRGTTPVLNFETPLSTSQFKECFITLKQNTLPYTIIEKTIEDININSDKDNQFSITLSQDETLSLNEEEILYIQLRVKTQDEKAYATEIFAVEVADVLKEGAI